MSVRNWPSLAAKAAVAASLLAAAAACGSSGSSSPPAAGATSAAPLSTAALISGSKQEKGLVIYSNALLTQMQEVTKAFQAKYPWIHVTVTDDEDPVVFSKYAAQHGHAQCTSTTRSRRWPRWTSMTRRSASAR
jgi:iron(III) transport system substrate-binding protein